MFGTDIKIKELLVKIKVIKGPVEVSMCN